MKVYIVFGTGCESWCWDKVYKDREKAEKRAEKLNKLPDFEEARRLERESDSEKSYSAIQEEMAQKLGTDHWACDCNFSVIEEEVIK